MPMIRPLDIDTDRESVAAFFERAADYVLLETGSPPNDGTVVDFFTDRPPTVDDENVHHLGTHDGADLLGITSVIFGFPEPDDCYIGLLLVSPAARGHGLGARLLTHVKTLARGKGANRLLVAVLDVNPKGRAFWEREGFEFDATFPPSDDVHTRHRLTRAV